MNLLQKLLLLPCLSPLILALALAGLNWNQPTALRLLTWRSPKLPVGALILLAAAGSAGLTGLAMLTAGGAVSPLRRRVHTPLGWETPGPGAWHPETEEGFRTTSTPGDQSRSSAENGVHDVASTAWPERDVRDPAPTVAVSYRVIKQGRAHRTGSAEAATDDAAIHDSSKGAPGDPSADDWTVPLRDDW